MTEMFSDVNFVAVIAAAVVAFVFGGLWYSPMLFANKWMELNGYSEEDLTNPTPKMVQGFVADLILATFLAVFLSMMGIQGLVMGALHGAVFAVFLIMPAVYPNYAFESKPLAHFFIHMGRTIIGMAIMGAIIGVM